MGQYKIVSGDTLGALARKYGTSVNALSSLNHISNPNRIYAGQSLNIPGYGGAIAAPSQSQPSAPAAPAVPSVDQYLAGDSTYQQQLGDFNKSKADYLAQWDQQNQTTNRDYQTSTRALNTQGNLDRDNQENDYAGRGILNSGVYATALGQYNDNFNIKMQNLQQGLQDNQNNQDNAKTNYLRQLGSDQDQAMQDAIKRRAQQLGI